MAISTTPNNESVDYRYFVCDLLSNRLLAEIPFKSVSYSRSLTEAGRFEGDISVVEQTYNLNLYENTLPGKTALYVVRDNLCVWGGIIWAREYSLVDRVLSVSASEFTSYLSHRVVWKTWNSAYEATAVVLDGTATITLVGGQYGFQEGESVWVDWGPDYAKYTGYFAVESVSSTLDDRSVFTVSATYVDVTGAQKVIPNMNFSETNPITVETRQDTFQYAKDLLQELNTDLFDFDFANDEIRPGIDLFNEIESVERQNNIATLTLTKKHELVVGQKISVTDVSTDSSFNASEATVSSIANNYVFSYENSGSNVSSSSETTYTYSVSSFSREGNIATYNTSSSHGLSAGDIVLVENVSETFDGYFTVYDVPSASSFKVVMFGSDIALSYTSSTAVATITGASGDGIAVTFTANNDFTVGASVEVTGVTPSSFNGDYYVQSKTDTAFTVDSTVTDTYSSGGTAKSNPPTVSRRAAVTYGTFGEHTTIGDLGFDFSNTIASSGNLEANPVIRGFELKNVAEILDEYATKPNGFEYRIDCSYDEAANSFKREFKFLPLIPSTLTQYIQDQGDGFTGEIPVSAYGADSRVFEFPGNVLEANMEENAEDAATRFFVQGKDPFLSSSASQPYSGASNHVLLNDGWPLLDAVDDLDSENETVLYKQAARLLEESVPPISAFSISVNGSANPKLGTYNPGDWCSVKLNDDFISQRAESNLEQDYGTDNGVLVRKILAYEVNVPDTPSYPEEVQLELITEPAIPLSGIQIIDGKAFLG